MLQDHSQDDVLELCRSASLDPSAYKNFAFAISKASSPPTDQLRIEAQRVSGAPPANQVESGEAAFKTETPGLLPASLKLLAEADSNMRSGAEATPQATTDQEERPGLPAYQNSLESNISALAAVHERENQQPAILPMVSGVGGCGATTILAALGRALSVIGERVLLVDARGPSTLDCFYESKGEKSNLLLSINPPSQLEGQVHVVRTHMQAPGAAQSYSTKLCRAASGLRGNLDRILVASAEWLPPSLGRSTWSGGICLVILTPELRSVLKVPSMLQAITDHSKQANVEIEPWFLLNRFDESSTAHFAMRNQLNAQLGSRLLPFVIPETDLVERALSLGISVLDLAPQSAFADACFDLAEWYRTTPRKRARSSGQAEETHLVSN
jgi:cellulose biosynthesis protein BcsQ